MMSEVLSLLPPSLARRFAASISLFRWARAFFDGLARTDPSPRQRTHAVAGTILLMLQDTLCDEGDEDWTIVDDEVTESDLLSPARGERLVMYEYSYD